EDRIGEAELGDAGSDLRHLLLGVGARVAGIGQQFGGRPLLELVGQPVHAATSFSDSRSAATCSKDWPVAIRVIGTPGWLCWKRLMATSTYSGAISMLRQMRPVRSAASIVVPLPPKGSNTMSPASV